jgi:putative hydrolase of the HAD superfamily
VPKAILFDLDETLTDRPASVVRYAERFHCDFASHLAPTTASRVADAVLTADVCGYHPAEQVLTDFSQRLPW